MKPFIIAGPCVIENPDIMDTIASEIVRLKRKYDIEIVFKASIDKANRTSLGSYRGIGFDSGVEVLKNIKNKYSLLVTTDVHECWQVPLLSKVVSIIQIPALLSRQTDLIVKASNEGNSVNIKKGQFMSHRDITYVIEKAHGNKTFITERGNCFGYNDIVVDFRNIQKLKDIVDTVIMDCSHSVQTPNTEGGRSGGNRSLIIPMAMAAKAFGVDGYFVEVHPYANAAKSDPDSSLYLDQLEAFVQNILE